MRKSDIALIGVISVMVIAAVYFIGIEYQTELNEERIESQRVAEQLSKLDRNLTDCDEVGDKLTALALEDFDGSELIVGEWQKISDELNCDSVSLLFDGDEP